MPALASLAPFLTPVKGAKPWLSGFYIPSSGLKDRPIPGFNRKKGLISYEEFIYAVSSYDKLIYTNVYMQITFYYN